MCQAAQTPDAQLRQLMPGMCHAYWMPELMIIDNSRAQLLSPPESDRTPSRQWLARAAALVVGLDTHRGRTERCIPNQSNAALSSAVGNSEYHGEVTVDIDVGG